MMDVKRFLSLPQGQQQISLTKMVKEYQELAKEWEDKQVGM